MRRIRSIISQLRWYVVNMSILLRSEKGEPLKHSVVFDLHQNVFHRYLLNFMLMLSLQGISIRIRHRPRTIGTWATNLLVRFVPGLRIQWGAPSPGSMVFTDLEGHAGSIVLDPDYFSPEHAAPDTYVLPMSMVDSLYVSGAHRWKPDLHALPRKPRLFFAGNMDNAHYNAEDLETLFGCLPRHKLISAILRSFPDRVQSPGSEAELFSVDQGDLVLIDRKRYNVPHDRMRPVLAHHDFFLAASGVIMPLCHNLVEAMSVGSIPVLQHAHLLHPPLEHGKNCISFRDEIQLIQRLEELPSIPEAEILKMRHNVLAYYGTYLSPEAVVGQIVAMGANLHRIRMNAEHLSVAMLRRSLSASRGLQ